MLYVSNSSGFGFYTRSIPIRTGIKAAFNQSSTKSCVGDTSYSNVAYVSGAGVYNIPNSFTPNNDGLNDVFNFYTLFMTGETISNVTDFEIEIYSHWGQLIHYGTDINKPWDGTAKGEIQPPGVYKYRIKFTDGNENRKYLEVQFT